MNRPISNTTCLCRVAVLIGLLTTGAQAEAGEPTETLRAVYTQANAIIRATAIDDRSLTAIRGLFGQAFDFRSAAERALGWRWQGRSATEQRDFTALFAGVVQRGFIYWLASVAPIDRSGGSLTVGYLGETVEQDQATVRTSIGRRGGGDVHLDHLMVYENRRWMVRDVSIEGISLIANYRSQFDHVIRTSSYQELIERMQERIRGDQLRPSSERPPPNRQTYGSVH